MPREVLREVWLVLGSGNADMDAINNAVPTACQMKEQQIALAEALMKHEVTTGSPL